MRIGYFGGSFDPPHRGHLTVARAARDRFQLDRVLLAPTGRQPFKPGGPQASFADRLCMTGLLCHAEPCLEASALEAPKADGSPNYTVDTLHQLLDDFATLTRPQLFVITGIDAFLGIPKWRSAEELFVLAEWVVVSRPDTSLSRLAELPLTPEQRARTHILDDILDPVSATDLRHRLASGESCHGLIPDLVLQYVQAHHLYGSRSAQPPSSADNGTR